MATEPNTEDRRDGRPPKVEWHRDPRLPLATGGVMLIGGVCLMAIGSALEGGIIAAAGAVNVASWARRIPALGNKARRALLALEIALLVACLGLFVWYAQTSWGWF